MDFTDALRRGRAPFQSASVNPLLDRDMRFRDRNGVRRRESTWTEDWNEAQRKLRERLQARDDNILDIVKKGEPMSFGEWADLFWRTIRSRPSAQRVRTKST